jgi:translation initiation factor 3 subunit M
VLTELVSTYTSFFDETVTESVTKLIVMAIADMDCYTFNDLLEMEAIQVVKSEKIYQLLEVFVTGKCTDFIKFCQLNDGYIESLGLDMSSCLHKIQVLTLLSLAENSSEIPFDVISSELQLEVYVFEQLIIDAIRSKLLTARIDHVNKKLIVTNCFHRTFDTNEWTVIYKELSAWKRSISKFRSNLKSVEFQHTCVQ